jgi:hypothetical protein
VSSDSERGFAGELTAMSNRRSIVRHHGVMAGGMNKRGTYGSMADRVARSGRAQPTAAVPVVPIKHCWVTGAEGKVPGLLLEWRRRPDGWHARVVRPVREGDGWVVVEEWLPAGLLDPVG